MFSLPIADLDHVLILTRPLWEEVRGRRLFMTGGTGFFGRWLTETFLWANQNLELGAELVVLSRRRQAHAPGLTFHTGDVTSFDFPRGQFSHVIHAATPADRAQQTSKLALLDTIVVGTRRTLDFARSCGAHKFLLTSSGAVYGPPPPCVSHIPEACHCGPEPLDPISSYGEGKRLAEHLCALYMHEYGIAAKIARGFAFVGPYLPLDGHFAIGNFIRDALRGGPIVVAGDGAPMRSYLYAADLAIWLWTILFRGKPCRAYNIGSDDAVSIATTAQIVAGVLAPHAKVSIAQPASPDQPPHIYVPCIVRARRELGLNVWIGLDEAVRRTGQWNRQAQISAKLAP